MTFAALAVGFGAGYYMVKNETYAFAFLIVALVMAVMAIGAFFILDDPIFNGLAVSLIFGILVSTVLTLVLIPILYFSYRNRTIKAA